MESIWTPRLAFTNALGPVQTLVDELSEGLLRREGNPLPEDPYQPTEGNIQPWSKLYKRLLNKPYVNEVTLIGQNPPLKCCQPLENLTHFITGLDLFY